MARIELTDSPVDIIAAESDLDATTVYTIQGEPEYSDLIHVDDGDNQPASEQGIRVRYLEMIRAKAGSGGKLWVWAPGKSAENRVFINVYEDV